MRFGPTTTLTLVLGLALAGSARAQDDGGLPPPVAGVPDASPDPSASTPDANTPDPSATPASNPATDAYGPHPAGTMLAPVRQRIIATALGEVGKVSDLGGEHGFKKGWERLKQYFDEASDWGPDSFAHGRAVQDGIQLAGRNPQGGEWCGIFAAWCCTQAGVQARWKFGVGPRPLVAHYDVQNIQPGDIGVIARYVHHFVVVKRDGDRVWSVSGNSLYHGISADSARPLSEIRYYYRPTEDVWVPDDGTTTPTPTASTGNAPTTPGLTGAVNGVASGSTTPAAAASGSASGVSSSHPLLEKGSHGAAVIRLQQLLDAQGATLDQDGVFGAATEQAVRAFQGSHGCHVDGIVGPETWGALESASAAPSAPATPATPATPPTPASPDAGSDSSSSATDPDADPGLAPPVCSPDSGP